MAQRYQGIGQTAASLKNLKLAEDTSTSCSYENAKSASGKQAACRHPEAGVFPRL